MIPLFHPEVRDVHWKDWLGKAQDKPRAIAQTRLKPFYCSLICQRGKRAQDKLPPLVTSIQHQPPWPLKIFVEGSVTGDPKPESFRLTDINCCTWSNSTWSVIKLQVPSGTTQYNDMLRCWDLFGEAVDDSGVEKAQIQSGSVFPFSAVYSSCVYCLALTHRPESQLMNYCSYFLLQVPLGRSGAAQMWK